MMRRVWLFALLLTQTMILPVFADDYADVLSSGKLVFGTAPDYVPFVFYDRNGSLTGIDVALMQEVGNRMGVRVEAMDMAFDGLIDALNVGQVDVIGGAFSKTDERGQLIDFSRVYFTGDAVFVTKTSTPSVSSVNPGTFGGHHIGLQRGTSFAQWVRTNLVDPGAVNIRDVYSYSKLEDAMRALDRGDVEYVLMDQDVYEDKYMNSGKYKLFFSGFTTENYVFGLRKNSSLTQVINGHLANMLKDGTAQAIANKFFTMNYSGIDPEEERYRPAPTDVPYFPQQPYYQPTPVPYNPPQPAACTNSMTFVADVTIRDGHEVKPGEYFTKTWRVQNIGTCTWNSAYTFGYVSGDQMEGYTISVPGVVQPGQVVDLSVPMRAPRNNGTYKGYWQMRTPQGQNFGETIWVKVRVNDGSKPPVQPTQAPKPKPTKAPKPKPTEPLTPKPMPAPGIVDFYTDPPSAAAGKSPQVCWKVKNTATVLIKIDGKTVYNGQEQKKCMRFNELKDGKKHMLELVARNVTDDSFSSFWYQPKKKKK